MKRTFGIGSLALLGLAGLAVPAASAAISQGSLMVTAMNTDTSGLDGFAIVALANLAAGEVVYITDNELTSAGDIAFNAGESYSKWTIGAGGIAAGSIVVFSAFDTTLGITPGAGTIASVTFAGNTNRGLSNGAESLYFYQAASDATADTATNQIAYINLGNSVAGQIPSSLNPDFTTTITTGSNSAQYTASRSSETSFGAYAPFIAGAGNWTGVPGATNPNAFDTTPFTIPTPGAASLFILGGIVSLRRRK